jgi:hypothetical protein
MPHPIFSVIEDVEDVFVVVAAASDSVAVGEVKVLQLLTAFSELEQAGIRDVRPWHAQSVEKG